MPLILLNGPLRISSQTLPLSLFQTSPDGLIWTARRVPVSNHWVAVCWSPQRLLFVAVAFNGTTNQRVMSSADGITWTAVTVPAGHIWRSVCWAAELNLFVAAANGSNDTTQAVMTSADGVTWTLRHTPAANSWGAICWAAELGLLVVVGQSERRLLRA